MVTKIFTTLALIVFCSCSALWSQVADDFSDGDFSNTPAWTGSTDKFVVEPYALDAGNLMLRSNNTGEATFYLSTPNALVANTQWDFFVNLRFATSGSNYVDVFLTVDNPNLNIASNGYFIRLGRSQDDITFWRRNGGSDVLLIDGPDGDVGSSSNNPFNFRITCSADGFWTILADPGATGNYEILGTVTDNASLIAGHFGFRIVQSSATSVVNNHWFDNILIQEIPQDLTPPLVVSANALGPTDVELFFDEVVGESSAAIVANYFIDGGVGNPSSAVRDGANPSRVLLNLTNPLANGQPYVLTVENVEDLAGNAMPPQNLNIQYFVPSEAFFREVVFNELMADPTPVVGLPDAEYIELYNASADKFFDLSGWTLVNSSTSRTLPSAVLPPGGHILLCNSANVALFEPFGTVVGIPSFVALTNSADSLTLLDPGGEIIDVVSYDDAWYNDPLKSEGGWTLEQINPFRECSGAINWSASLNPEGGTPNQANSIFNPDPDITPPTVTDFTKQADEVVRIQFSEIMDEASLLAANYAIDQGLAIAGIQASADLISVFISFSAPLETGVAYTLSISGPLDCEGNALPPTDVILLFGEVPQFGDLIINEIMADPTPEVGLPPHEYFELYNVSDKVIDMKGCELSGSFFTFPAQIMPGAYLLGVSSSVVGDFDGFPEVYAMQGMSTTFFTNTGRNVELFNQEGQLVNSVAYSLEYYQDPAKQDGGWSMELINPLAPCTGAQNWRASTASPGGTPGTQNSVFDTSPDVVPPVVADFQVIDPNTVVVVFNEIMDETSLLEASYSWTSPLETISVIPGEGLMAVSIGVSAPIETGVVYTITINGPQDCSGNALSPNTSVIIQTGEVPGPYELLITEIMADPSPGVGLPEAEYLELYNASSKVLEVQGTTLSGTALPTGRLLQPGEYLLVASEASEEQFNSYPGAYFIPDWSTTFLTNSGRELLLSDASGEFIDRVNYTLDWYRDASKDDGGWSLERINLLEPCRGGDNWTASINTNGGTPGAENSVNSIMPDTILPGVISVFVLTPKLVEIRFSEVIDSDMAPFALVEIAGIDVQGITSVAPEHTAIQVILANALVTGVIYEMNISGVADCTGNVMLPAGPLPLAIPQEGFPGDLIINEVLFNPRDGGVDFVEIVNLSEKAIGLGNWTLQNQGGTTSVITPDPLIILPGAYMVLTSDPLKIAVEYPLGRAETFVKLNDGTPAFNNTSGSVIITDPSLAVIDRFDYLESYHLSLLREVKGVSLERLSFTRPTNDPGNWTSAAQTTGFATPGYVNSQFAPEGTATASFELQNDVFSPDNDGFEDVLLINYKLDFAGAVATIKVYDRRGRSIRTLANNVTLATQGTISWDGTTNDGSKARIGPHIIYIDLFDLSGGTTIEKLGCVVAGRLGN